MLTALLARTYGVVSIVLKERDSVEVQLWVGHVKAEDCRRVV
jgi:hypothetical protein